MDSDPQDIVDAKAEFRKPSADASSRKYRRRSPCDRSSPASDDSPSRDRSSSPALKREYEKVYDDHHRKDSNRELDRDSGRNRYGQSGDSYKHSDRQSSRSSRSNHHRDYYDRRDKYANDRERENSKYANDRGRENSKLSYRSGRESRGNTCSDHQKQDGVERHSRDKLDDSGYRGRDKDRDNSYPVPSRRHGSSNSDDVKYGDRDRNKEDRESLDYKNRRSEYGDHRNNHSPAHDEFREYPYDSSSRRDSSGRRLCESSRGHSEKYSKEEKRKYDDQDRYKKFDEWRSPKTNDLDSPSKKPKALNMDASTGRGNDADEKQSSTSKQTLESTGKLTSEKAYVTDADIDAAKIAAMKAAELVNRNLVGTGFMSTEQKKKLLWGNKKATTIEEPAHSWDTSLFGDRERQEKFKKLMGVKGDIKVEHKPEMSEAEKEKIQLDLEKQYTAGLRRRDGRTVGLGL